MRPQIKTGSFAGRLSYALAIKSTSVYTPISYSHQKKQKHTIPLMIPTGNVLPFVNTPNSAYTAKTECMRPTKKQISEQNE